MSRRTHALQTIQRFFAKLPVYMNQHVATPEQIDALHGQPLGSARRVFLLHQGHFTTDLDYFRIPSQEWRKLAGPIGDDDHSSPDRQLRPGKVIALTIYGYVLITKPFMDPLAWAVLREIRRAVLHHTEPGALLKLVTGEAVDDCRSYDTNDWQGLN